MIFGPRAEHSTEHALGLVAYALHSQDRTTIVYRKLTLNPSSGVLLDRETSDIVVIRSPLLTPLVTLRLSPAGPSQSERATEACETALLLALIWEGTARWLCLGDVSLLFPLASLAKRTSVARSGEDAVPGDRDLKIERFLSDITLSSCTASSDKSAHSFLTSKLTMHIDSFQRFDPRDSSSIRVCCTDGRS